MLVGDASFVVVDTETTGGSAASDRIIEIAATKIRGGKIVDRFEALVNPECAVPSRITRLTGISTAMVFDKPPAADILPNFFDFLGGGVFVAHNLTFDLRFVNRERARCRRPEVPNATLCTLRLARRLLPGLRSKGLASLAAFYGIKNRRHHRALADADATAEILLRFLDHMDLEFGIERLPEVLAFQYRRYADLKHVSRHVARIREDVLSGLPEQPGVYFMKDSRGRTIYVGKAQNLSSRVRSYFTSIEGHAPRTRKMVKSVRDVEWQVTDSELDALLLESRLIKELQPRHNKAHLQYVNRPFIRIETSHTFPRVSLSAYLQNDGAEYYGPLSGRAEASFLLDLIDRFFKLRECEDGTFARRQRCVYASIGRCFAPCEDESAESLYAGELDRVRDFLSGKDHSVVKRIEEAMKDAAAELDYEQAALLRDWIRKLERMLGKRKSIATRVFDHNAVVIHLSDSRMSRFLVICRGRHVDTVTFDRTLPDPGMVELEGRLDRYMTGDADAPGVYREREIDELYLLSHWLYVHRNDVRQIRWEDGEPVAAMMRKVRGELAGIETEERTLAESC